MAFTTGTPTPGGLVLKVLLVVVLFAVATYYLIRVIERRGVARPVRRRPQPRPQQRGRWPPTTTRSSCATSTSVVAPRGPRRT